MTYNRQDMSCGVELEYADCYRFDKLPKGAKWNNADNTVVNSNGIANDPLGKVYKYGGEINTKPTDNPEDQIKHIEDINNVLTIKPSINYRCNLHIHIRVNGLKNDLHSCKKLLSYIDKYQQRAFDIVEQIPLPSSTDKTEHDWELKRYKRRKKSHQYKLPQSRVKAMMSANTVEEFYVEHAPKTDRGRMWYFSPRAGINLRQMWEETNTIEFRHFPATLCMQEMKSCLEWCYLFLENALNDEEPPEALKKKYDFKFPKFEKYNYLAEQLYQYTNFDNNTRKVATTRIGMLENYIDLSKSNLEQVYKVYQRIKA